MQLMVLVTRQKQQIWFYLEQHLNGWDARGAITRQFSLFTWEIVTESCGHWWDWCNIVMHVTFVTLHFMFLALDDDDGQVPEECLDARFRGP